MRRPLFMVPTEGKTTAQIKHEARQALEDYREASKTSEDDAQRQE